MVTRFPTLKKVAVQLNTDENAPVKGEEYATGPVLKFNKATAPEGFAKFMPLELRVEAEVIEPSVVIVPEDIIDPLVFICPEEVMEPEVIAPEVIAPEVIGPTVKDVAATESVVVIGPDEVIEPVEMLPKFLDGFRA